MRNAEGLGVETGDPMDWTVLSAYAQDTAGAPAGSPPMLFSLLPFLLIFAVFYFLLIVPQQRQRKKHKQMLEDLKKGDRVMTTGGLLGTVSNIHKDVVTLQMGDNIKMKVKKEYIANLQAGEDEG
jgi:preprotein translocase subunit YajC